MVFFVDAVCFRVLGHHTLPAESGAVHCLAWTRAAQADTQLVKPLPKPALD